MHIRSFINHSATNLQTQFSKKNPFNGESLHQVDSVGLIEVVMSIQGAQKAFSEWKTSSIEERTNLLQHFHNHISLNAETFSRLEALDQGLPLDFVKSCGVQDVLKNLDLVMRELNTLNTDASITYSPVGVIAIIGTWNLSLRTICERLFPAIAAGNAVIIKVSSQSPVTSSILAELCQLAKVPTGLIQILNSDQDDVKKLLVTHPGIKAVSFIGELKNASEVLKSLSSTSLQQFKKIQIASGSKNSAVALNDPDSSSFAQIMNSFLIGQGQLGWNSSRLYVLEKFESQWKEKILTYLQTIKPSEAIEDQSLWTPCLKESSFRNYSEISALAVKDQAQLIQTKHGLSESQKRNFLPISFTQDMSNCSTLQQDQVHAPLFILSVVKYPFDVAKYSNVSYYGMAAHLYGEPERLAKVADGLDVGLICQNKWSAEVTGPIRSVKQSGFGIQDYQVFGAFFSNVKKLS